LGPYLELNDSGVDFDYQDYYNTTWNGYIRKLQAWFKGSIVKKGNLPIFFYYFKIY